jgi:uncharacterized protein DUF4268
MPIFRMTSAALQRVPETTFAQEKLLERKDLQRLLRSDISVLDSDIMVVAEEYGDWEDSSRRIDLLGVDKGGSLVVIELKRTEDGGLMDLQAVRYAAMVSSMTFEQLVAAHAQFIGGDDAHLQAEKSLLGFLGWESAADAALTGEVKIVLVSANFSVELTTAVLWLNKRNLDITCVRLRPYRLDGQVLIDVQQIIPLPEAADYETKIRAQQQETRKVESSRHKIFRKFWSQLIERSRPKTSVVANRTGGRDHWLTGGLGKSGFQLNFVLLQEESRVECYIDQGKGSDESNLATLKKLEAQREQIETQFGNPLDWQELEDSRGCRICYVLHGGWRTPENAWPDLQDRMIDAMVRLEKAIKGPVLDLASA